MAGPVQHLLLHKRAVGLFPDLFLVAGICWYRGKRVPETSLFFRAHRFCHLPERIVLYWFLRPVVGKKAAICLIEHLVLDYMTHGKEWRTTML